jgi:hypothetical protein
VEGLSLSNSKVAVKVASAASVRPAGSEPKKCPIAAVYGEVFMLACWRTCLVPRWRQCSDGASRSEVQSLGGASVVLAVSCKVTKCDLTFK